MDFGSFLPDRSFEDIISERVRLTIGGRVYNLPAKSVEENSVWLASLEADFQKLMNALADLREDRPAVVALLTRDPDWLIDHLVSYDHTGVLPRRATIRKGLTPMQLLMAVAEVWRAAHPLADTLLAAIKARILEAVPIGSSAPTALRRKSSAGPIATSAGN